MAELTGDQRRQLDALRHAYATELPEKVTTIARAAAALGGSAWDPTAVQELHQLVHRLAGSSAIWGFTTVSQVAGRLEQVVFSALEHARPPAEDLSGEVHRLLDALQHAVPGAADPRAGRTGST